MKPIIFLILIIFTVNVNGCKLPVCRGIGDECTADMHEVNDPSDYPKICTSNLNCVELIQGKPTCIQPLLEGARCNSSDQCGPGLYCNGRPNQICQPGLFANLGEKCTHEWDCHRGLQCDPTISKCVVQLSENATLEGYQCEIGLYHCEFGKYCDSTTHKCLTRKQNGEKCNEGNECKQFSICNGPVTGQKYCSDMFSVGEGGDCLVHSYMYRQYISACNISQGLRCTNEFKCVKFDTTESPSTLNSSEAFYDCVDQAFCVYTPDYEGKNSCSMVNCRKQFCDMQGKCSKQTRAACFAKNITYLNFGVCEQPFPSEKIPGSSNILLSNTILSFFSIVILSIFF
ncbi:hypothetical protein DFA_08148 [Cavenderia fasciculata]|uniref:Paramecium surface antigen repeat-containing protein n=1 Tax=Cavenderia fasciculata TaxID=261658 RepID=F4Q5A5_CACFS|nr:uncharacterized protein DFA_08148 [Cavenderia fasciculata]EGG17164.1 hypothetical protein DFA_08148 [Cavenderia fasciculata]|eukprot:XP_004355648.1 hypothetical protein DFA_08148 [Cavenderia fasciculata]